MIKLSKNSLRISKKILEASEAWLWVGFGFSPIDNNSDRIEDTRNLMNKYYDYIPYGMRVGNKNEKGEVFPIKNEDGYFEIDLSWWPVGIYRLNIYSEDGSELRWGQIFQESFTNREAESVKKFAHKEENGEGYSIRILIKPNREIEALGD